MDNGLIVANPAGRGCEQKAPMKTRLLQLFANRTNASLVPASDLPEGEMARLKRCNLLQLFAQFGRSLRKKSE